MKTWGTVYLLVATCLLTVSSASARTWYIKADGSGDVPTIQAGVDSASHGDTVLCAAGTYSWSNQGTGNDFGMISILRGSSDMVIRSEFGPEVTILDGQFMGRVFFFQGETDLTVEGFTFKRGEAPSNGNFVGAGFTAHLSSPVLRDCIFRNNHATEQGGAYWYGGVGAPILENCQFINNSSRRGGAVFLINSPLDAVVLNCTFTNNSSTNGGGAMFLYNFKVSIDYCLFENNSSSSGGGIEFISTHPITINGCTIVDNDAPTGAGINVLGTSTVMATNTIIANNNGGGVGANVEGAAVATFSCSDIWGNAGGDWVGGLAAQLGVNGNISADPLFCSGGYMLQGNSPCSPGNHPDGEACGVIGLFPVGCGSVNVEHKTWGEIKSMYSE